MTSSELRAYRKALGFTCKQMGAYLGVSQPTVSHWESSKYSIPKWVDKLLIALQELEKYQQPTFLPEIPPWECRCGCGGITKINHRTDTAKGWVRGEYRAFLSGHNIRAMRREG